MKKQKYGYIKSDKKHILKVYTMIYFIAGGDDNLRVPQNI